MARKTRIEYYQMTRYIYCADFVHRTAYWDVLERVVGAALLCLNRKSISDWLSILSTN